MPYYQTPIYTSSFQALPYNQHPAALGSYGPVPSYNEQQEWRRLGPKQPPGYGGQNPIHPMPRQVFPGGPDAIVGGPYRGQPGTRLNPGQSTGGPPDFGFDSRLRQRNLGEGYSSPDIYGRRPDPVTLADPASNLGQQIPGLQNMNASLSGEIQRMISGTDPNLPILAQNTGANRAAALGMTGSGFGSRMADLSLYDRRNQQRMQGISAYNQTIPTISGTQTNSPTLQMANQTQNNIWDSSPNPAAATQEALRLYQQQLGQLSGNTQNPVDQNQRTGPLFQPKPQSDSAWYTSNFS